MAYRPTAKTEARKQAQLQLLIESALLVVSARGFGALTMNALARQAELGTGTVYRYFDNKAHLCTEVFRIATEKELELVLQDAFPDHKSSCQERLSNVIVGFCHRAISGRKLAYALIAEAVDPEVDEQRLKYRHAYANIFRRLIDEGMASNVFIAQDSAISAAAIVGILAETLLTPLGAELAPESDSSESFSRDIFIRELEQLCLRTVGILTPYAAPKTKESRHVLSNA